MTPLQRRSVAGALVTLAFVACTLNPQPLPPEWGGEAADNGGEDAGLGFGGSADAAGPPAEPQIVDAGSSDGGDAGDAGDGGLLDGDAGDGG